MVAKVLNLTVGDLMQREVTTVSPGTSVHELARLLSDHGISGAPVVAATGEVVGVVSSTDVVRLAADEFEIGPTRSPWRSPELGIGEDDVRDVRDRDDLPEGSASFFMPEDAAVTPEWDLGSGSGVFDGYTVADIMTPVSFAMSPTASIPELADFLLRGRIHRAVVTEEGRLAGIVTTMDVLRVLAEETT